MLSQLNKEEESLEIRNRVKGLRARRNFSQNGIS